jgi:hypothetical protein
VSGLAPNCAATGTTVTTFSVNPPDTTTVWLPVSCTAITGVIQVRAATTGPDQDPDGYDVSLDGGPAQALPPNGVTRFTGLPEGPHTISVSGVAGNCSMPGSNPMQVDIAVGGTIRDTASLSLAVTCTAVTGALRISAATGGADPDPAYLVRLDATPDRPISKNGTLLVTHLEPGSHTVLLTDIAPNCATSGPNPMTVTVAIGDTTDVAFPVTCLPNPLLRVTVSTTGSDIPAGYFFYVDWDGGYYGPADYKYLNANGTDSLVVTPGVHSVALAYVPSNCTVNGPTSVTLVAGTTTDIAFTVECVANPILRVSVATTGPNAPATYLVGVDAGYWYQYNQEATVPSNGSTSIAVLPGDHYVTLDLVPLNCIVTSPNSVLINVPLGPTTDLAFAVTCH